MKISLFEMIDMGVFDWSEEKEVMLIIKNFGVVFLMVENIVIFCGCILVEYSWRFVFLKDSLVIKIKYKVEFLGYFNKDIVIYCNVLLFFVYVKLLGKV